MRKILIVNGPNLNLLGIREPEIYGSETFESYLDSLRAVYPEVELLYYQSNHEGALIDRIQETLKEDLTGLVVNLGAYTHYSHALGDALRMLKIPKIEVHISHIFAREAFRHQSVISPACQGLISGMGKDGYRLAIEWLLWRQ
ncbi:MAG: 3-dehydroquinate dehydratase [Bacteroidetes bacterium]|jgi:3-dehydroquinate dehydratase II|nr:MAG: 3-dehydroquinate dehydratase [Bacteroidota bacterium]